MPPQVMPYPPASWWSGVPWWGYFLLVVVLVMGLPAMNALIKGRMAMSDRHRQYLLGLEQRVGESTSNALIAAIKRAEDAERREAESIDRWRADAEKGWGWYRSRDVLCHKLYHECANARQLVDSGKLPHSPWSDISLPDINEGVMLSFEEYTAVRAMRQLGSNSQEAIEGDSISPTGDTHGHV